jgi:hypothetical protein
MCVVEAREFVLQEDVYYRRGAEEARGLITPSRTIETYRRHPKTEAEDKFYDFYRCGAEEARGAHNSES